MTLLHSIPSKGRDALETAADDQYISNGAGVHKAGINTVHKLSKSQKTAESVTSSSQPTRQTKEDDADSIR